MNRYLIVFIIISFLAVASLIVYAKNNVTPESKQSNKQDLFNFDSGKDQAVASPTPNMNQQQIKELKIEDIKEGTGSAVKAGDTAEVNYLGTLLDGTKFDSSYDRNQTFEFSVGAGMVIKGWDEGLIGMKIGGKRKLIIPSDLAYGPSGAGGVIGPNMPLIFEIELVNIK